MENNDLFVIGTAESEEERNLLRDQLRLLRRINYINEKIVFIENRISMAEWMIAENEQLVKKYQNKIMAASLENAHRHVAIEKNSSSKPDLDIEGEDYYHDSIVKDDLPGLLETYGDYIVRTECKPSELPIYVLSLNIGKESLDVKEFPITNDGGQYSLAGGQKYDKVVPLIKDLLDKKANLPECVHELVRAVKRQAWEEAQINDRKRDIAGIKNLIAKGQRMMADKKQQLKEAQEALFALSEENARRSDGVEDWSSVV